jgi:hypothetical protein
VATLLHGETARLWFIKTKRRLIFDAEAALLSGGSLVWRALQLLPAPSSEPGID